jgi:hypothetical protein
MRAESTLAACPASLRGAFVGRDALIPWTFRHYRRRRHLYPESLGRFNMIRLRSTREVESFLSGL